MKSEVQDSNHAIDVTHMMLTETQERCLLGSLKDALEVHFIDASQYNNDSQNLGGQPYFVATIARRNDVTSDKWEIFSFKTEKDWGDRFIKGGNDTRIIDTRQLCNCMHFFQKMAQTSPYSQHNSRIVVQDQQKTSMITWYSY